jgi:iron complex outermembrane receptor protein
MDALPLLLSWGNMMEGEIYGLEAWGDLQATPRWRLTAGFNVQHENLRFKPGASTVNSVAAAGNDPDVQASLRSSLALSDRLHWYAALRYVGRLPNPYIPPYAEFDTSLTFDVTPRLALSITGANLLHHRHLEYEEAGATIGNEVDRNVSAGLRLRF